MEKFRQIGEVLGSLKALMVFGDNIQINQRQCYLLLDVLSFAYESIAEEMRNNLKFEERNLKWRILEHPLKELHRIFKDGEAYIRQCLETKDWWAKAIILYRNTDCVQFHIHNLLSCIPIVVESIEIAGELSGWDQEEIQMKRFIYANKYQREWKDPKLFQWKLGKQYLVSQDFCNRFNTVWKEDRWILLHKIKEKKTGTVKQDHRLKDLLFKNLDGSGDPNEKILPSSILVGSKDYQVRRRLGSGSQFKEVQWLGESFAMRHFFGDIEPLLPEISLLLSLSHPNILYPLCGFTGEENKECFLLMELMNKDLGSYIKEICGPRRRIPFSLLVAAELMLQIARGMEYLHSRKIYHGDLNPSNIFVKSRCASSSEGYLHLKISGFGLSSVKNFTSKSPTSQNGTLPFIWYAPEVLEEQEQTGSTGNSKYMEKSDVYSFGMVCFELLTGKVPFEESHLQGDKMSRNIRAGERPLFPSYSPKYIINLTKRCWHADPNQRPTFSSICRILRYTKRFLTMNPDYNRELYPPTPGVDFWEIESKLQKKFPTWDASDSQLVSQIPFQMFVYRVVEKEKTGGSPKDLSESGSDRTSYSGDENVTTVDDPFPSAIEKKFLPLPEPTIKKLPVFRKSPDVRQGKQAGTPKGRIIRPPQITPCGSSLRMRSESRLLTSPRIRRTSSASDSELP